MSFILFNMKRFNKHTAKYEFLMMHFVISKTSQIKVRLLDMRNDLGNLVWFKKI